MNKTQHRNNNKTEITTKRTTRTPEIKKDRTNLQRKRIEKREHF